MPIIEGGNVITGGVVDEHTGPHIYHAHLGAAPTNGVSEVQDVDDGDATAGDFTLVVTMPTDVPGGGETVPIAFDDNAAAVKAALDAIAGVTVTVTGTGTVADPFVVTFTEPGGDVPLMTIGTDTTTGGSGASVAANTTGVLGTYANIAEPESLLVDHDTGVDRDAVYENQGTKAIPAWVRIDTV